MLCSSHSILPWNYGSFFKRACSYCFLDFCVSKSSRTCCSVADMSSNFLLLLSLCSARNAPWCTRCFASHFLCRRSLCGCMACSVAVPRFWHSLLRLCVLAILLNSRKRLLALEPGKAMIDTQRECRYVCLRKAICQNILSQCSEGSRQVSMLCSSANPS